MQRQLALGMAEQRGSLQAMATGSQICNTIAKEVACDRSCTIRLAGTTWGTKALVKTRFLFRFGHKFEQLNRDAAGRQRHAARNVCKVNLRVSALTASPARKKHGNT